MPEEFSPNLVGFLCKWCSYAGADLAGTSRKKYPPNVVPVRVMCSSRVDPVALLFAYLRGADGVMMAGCHPGDCHYAKGNYHARRRFVMIDKIVETLGLEPDRFMIRWVSASEGPRFAETVDHFVKRVKDTGPSPAKTEVFL
jgi:F420-non-reducing hydrogenase iron-sulfur subunit